MMAATTDEKQLAAQKINRITIIGLVLNIILSVGKMIVGWWAASTALVADGIHSLSDMATDLALIVGVHFSNKKPDTEHPYGHGRMETFAALAISIALVIVGLGLVWRAGYDIIHHEPVPPSVVVMVVAFISVVSKEWLYQVTKRVAKQTHSAATYANAWHHRSDALSSVAVLAGIGSMYLGFKYGDELATVAVGIMILLVGYRVLADSMGEFAERAVDKTTHEQITGILKSDTAVHDWHKLRTRIVGREIFLDLHILVDRQLSITKAHEISERLEASLHERLDRPVNIIIHIEPDTPELRARG